MDHSLALKLAEILALVVWSGLCADVLWEPSVRAGEAIGRWIEDRLSH
jgi:hypothetical protein